MASKQELSEARELVDLNVKEVSLVDRAAIQREFLVTKRSEDDMAAEEAEKAEETTEEATTEEATTEEPAAAEATEEEVADDAAEATSEESEKSLAEPQDIAEAMSMFEQMIGSFEGAHKAAGEMMLATLRSALAEKTEQTEEAATEKADADETEVEKARRFTQSRREQLEALIETATSLLKDFEGEPPKTEEEETTKREEKPNADQAIELISKRVAELVLKQVEPRLEETEKRVESVEKTVPAPRSAHPEANPTEKEVRKAEDIPTDELFGGFF